MSGKLITFGVCEWPWLGGLLGNFFREGALQMIGLCCNFGRRRVVA